MNEGQLIICQPSEELFNKFSGETFKVVWVAAMYRKIKHITSNECLNIDIHVLMKNFVTIESFELMTP